MDELIEKNIKFKRNYDYESIDRKYIHNNHFYELPRKKIHREETKNIFSKHLKGFFSFINFFSFKCFIKQMK